MKDPQMLRDEARGFLDKANDTNDKAIRKVLLERALRLVQQAGMIHRSGEPARRGDRGRAPGPAAPGWREAQLT